MVGYVTFDCTSNTRNAFFLVFPNFPYEFQYVICQDNGGTCIRLLTLLLFQVKVMTCIRYSTSQSILTSASYFLLTTTYPLKVHGKIVQERFLAIGRISNTVNIDVNTVNFHSYGYLNFIPQSAECLRRVQAKSHVVSQTSRSTYFSLLSFEFPHTPMQLHASYMRAVTAVWG